MHTVILRTSCGGLSSLLVVLGAAQDPQVDGLSVLREPCFGGSARPVARHHGDGDAPVEYVAAALVPCLCIQYAVYPMLT